MRNLWIIILLVTEASLVLLATRFLDSALAKWAVFVIMLFAAIKTLSNNNATRKLLDRQLKALDSRISFYLKKQKEQQHQQDKHESFPHVFATAIIKINGLVALKSSTGAITSITDNGLGWIEVNIDNPEHFLLIPSVESDSLENVSVKADASNNSVSMFWAKGEPGEIYLTITKSC